jgi:hypothetical protein
VRSLPPGISPAGSLVEDAAGLIALAAYAVEASEYTVVDVALARAEADDLEAAR